MRDKVQRRFRLCNSLFSCSFLHSFRHHIRTPGRDENADIEEMEKIIAFITCAIALCQYVCELVFGVNVFDLDLGVQIDSIKQPIKSNSMGSRHMSHCRASSLYDHLDYCFVVFKNVEHRTKLRRLHV